MQGDKMIPTDLFEFAYVPDWYGQLDELAEMALCRSPGDLKSRQQQQEIQIRPY